MKWKLFHCLSWGTLLFSVLSRYSNIGVLTSQGLFERQRTATFTDLTCLLCCFWNYTTTNHQIPTTILCEKVILLMTRSVELQPRVRSKQTQPHLRLKRVKTMMRTECFSFLLTEKGRVAQYRSIGNLSLLIFDIRQTDLLIRTHSGKILEFRGENEFIITILLKQRYFCGKRWKTRRDLRSTLFRYSKLTWIYWCLVQQLQWGSFRWTTWQQRRRNFGWAAWQPDSSDFGLSGWNEAR